MQPWAVESDMPQYAPSHIHLSSHPSFFCLAFYVVQAFYILATQSLGVDRAPQLF